VAQEPALARALEPPVVVAGVGQQAVTQRAQGRESPAPGLHVFLGPLQHGDTEDAEDASRTEAAAKHVIKLWLDTHMAERELALERAKPPVGSPLGGANPA
jgi:hypothetical protein